MRERLELTTRQLAAWYHQYQASRCAHAYLTGTLRAVSAKLRLHVAAGWRVMAMQMDRGMRNSGLIPADFKLARVHLLAATVCLLLAGFTVGTSGALTPDRLVPDWTDIGMTSVDFQPVKATRPAQATGLEDQLVASLLQSRFDDIQKQAGPELLPLPPTSSQNIDPGELGRGRTAGRQLNTLRPGAEGTIATDPVDTILVVPDPKCHGRCVEVAVCLPSCCVDSPRVDTWCGLLRRGVVYTWPCGYRVQVTFGLLGRVCVRFC